MAQYRDYIFTLMDILGFREIVAQRSAEEINKLLKLTQEHTEPDPEEQELFEFGYVAFSDCVVRGVPLDSDANKQDPVGLLFHELLHLTHVQGELAARGVFVRGGITIGKAFFSARTVFGPALVRAYEIESKEAVFPRIVIDEPLLRAVHSDPRVASATNGPEGDEAYIKRLIYQDDVDGKWYVDYVRGFLTEEDKPGTFLPVHKKRLESALSKCLNNPKVHAKYDWLARQHNRVVTSVAGAGSDLLVVIPPLQTP